MNVAVTCFRFPVYSESFVIRHIESLEASVIASNVDSNALERRQFDDGRVFECGRPFISAATRPYQRILQYVSRRVGLVGILGNKDAQAEFTKGLKKLSPDVLLIEFGHLAVSLLPVLKILKIPFIVHFHGIDLSACWKIPAYQRQVAELCCLATAVVVVNERLQKARLLSVGCTPEKIHVIPCGADVDKFTLNDGIDKNPIRFITASRLIAKKGPLETLQAFRLVAEKYPDATLVMIGDGSLLNQCRRYVERNNLGNKIRLTGAISHTQVGEEMRRAHVFLQHSLISKSGDEEGWGVSIAEGAACGMPVVSTLSGGIPENVLDGVTGFLVPEKDVKTMADRMLLLARDPSLRKSMGLAGRRHVELNGNARVQCEKLKALCREAIKQ